MTGFSEGLGTFVTGFSFWAAVAVLGVSGLLALSKLSGDRRVHPPRGGAKVLVLGLITAFLIISAPRLTAMGSDVAGGVVGGGEGGGVQRPGVMEYFATLSTDGRWIAGVVVVVWVAAVVATIAAALSRQGSTTE